MTIKSKSKYLLIPLSIIFCDQLAKYWIHTSFSLFQSRIIIPGFMRLHYVQNRGAIWGVMSRHNGLIPTIITLLAIGALIVVAMVFFKLNASNRLELFALACISGGALGNIIDRVRCGYVVDFIDCFIGNQHWPTFNIADACISLGVILMAIAIWRGKCTPS